MINRTNGNGEGSAHRTRVLIVDDHPLMRRGLSELISREPDLVVCGEAEDAATALEVAKTANPHLMTVDISLKEGSGIELIKQLKATNPEISTLAFSMHDENLYAERAMRAGAKGYISKDAPSGDVIAAIRRIRDGKIYMSEKMADRVHAFRSRGPRSPYESKELEDLIGMLDAGHRLVDEIAETEPELRQHISAWAREFLADPEHPHLLEEHLPRGPGFDARMDLVMSRLTRLSTLR